MNCVFKFDNRTFKSELELDEYLMNLDYLRGITDEVYSVQSSRVAFNDQTDIQ